MQAALLTHQKPESCPNPLFGQAFPAIQTIAFYNNALDAQSAAGGA
jgi:hypothetical protein